MTLGQYTGHVSVNDIRIEIRKLLDIIEIEKIDNESDKGFVANIRKCSMYALWKPSGKQVFRLREIKDRQL